MPNLDKLIPISFSVFLTFLGVTFALGKGIDCCKELGHIALVFFLPLFH